MFLVGLGMGLAAGFGLGLLGTEGIFHEADSFGQSLMADIIEPMMSECKSLAHMAEETHRILADIDAALEEVRSID